jgi:hypothetical protein
MVQFAETDTLVPRISQGMPSGGKTTAYEIQQQVAASSKYIGAVVRRFDECLIEPIVSWFYNYNMRDPDNQGKGNFAVQAQGFAAYQDRLLQFDQLMKLTQIFMGNPMMAVNTNIRAIQEKMAIALDQDPSVILRTEAEAQQALQAMNTSPMQLAQQALVDAEAKLRQAQAVKTISEVRNSRDKLAIERAKAVAQLGRAQRKADKLEGTMRRVAG